MASDATVVVSLDDVSILLICRKVNADYFS